MATSEDLNGSRSLIALIWPGHLLILLALFTPSKQVFQRLTQIADP
jgi:hypothetical protein